jgi:predicted enzyme related to lactoylglutathione lyase
MARLRHFAVCVNDLDKAAKFYETVFDLKRIAREDLDIGSAIYMSDGTINLALLNFSTGAGTAASDLKNPKAFVGAHHFGFQVDDLAETQKKIEAAGGKFFFDLGDPEDDGFERKFYDPNGIVFDINWKGWQLTKTKVKNAKGGLVPATKRAAAARKKVSKKTGKPGKMARKRK